MTAAARARHLTVAAAPVPATPPLLTAVTQPARPAVVRLCAGDALALSDEDIDFADLVNAAGDLVPVLLDEDIDPDDYRLAEVLVEYLCTHHGIHRHAKGDRLQDVSVSHRRYLLPFLVELAETRPVDRRGVAHLRLTHLETLPRMLAGALPLPAATVAGDRLDRRGIARADEGPRRREAVKAAALASTGVNAHGYLEILGINTRATEPGPAACRSSGRDHSTPARATCGWCRVR